MAAAAEEQTVVREGGREGAWPSSADAYREYLGAGSDSVDDVVGLDAGGAVTTLHTFAYADGANPIAGLLQSRDGKFYGTTTSGRNGYGTVFRMMLDQIASNSIAATEPAR